MKSNFWKGFCIAMSIFAKFQRFLAKLGYVKKVHPEQFSKIHFVTYFHPNHDKPSSLPRAIVTAPPWLGY